MSIMAEPAGQEFQKSDLLRMFPTFVWKAELRPEVYQPINDQILRTLGELRAPLADLMPGESWQSDHGLHELDGFRAVAPRCQHRQFSRSETADRDHPAARHGTDGREYRAGRRRRRGRRAVDV